MIALYLKSISRYARHHNFCYVAILFFVDICFNGGFKSLWPEKVIQTVRLAIKPMRGRKRVIFFSN